MLKQYAVKPKDGAGISVINLWADEVRFEDVDGANYACLCRSGLLVGCVWLHYCNLVELDDKTMDTAA